MKKLKKQNKLSLNVLTSQLVYLSVIILFAVVLSIIKPTTIYIALIIILFTAVCSIYVCLKEIKNKKERIDEISKGFSNSLKDNLYKMDIPMIIFSSPMKIIWQNNLAKTLLPDDYVYDVAVQLEKKDKFSEEIRHTSTIDNGKSYEAIGNYIDFENSTNLLVSFIDKTEENSLKEIIDNTKVTVGIIFIDNYEETFLGLDDIQKGEITSKLDTILRSWLKENNGIITKLDKDRYVMFIEKQYIEKMEETKFEVLDTVKEITNITKLPITISIGMSSNEINLSDRYNASNAALDIALGRGGDQVVIKKDKKYDFFGGANIALEKTSRVRARTIASALCDIIDKSDKVYIIGHKNTDVDCIGAAIGMHKIATSLNKKAYIIADNKYDNGTKLIIDRVKTSGEYDDAFITKEEIRKHDFENSVLIVVDTHKKSYLSIPEILEEFDKVVVIDHHRRGPEFIENTVLTYHEIYASSTSELITEILMYMENIKLTTIEAESLYAGILIDTKNFTFKTGVRTFEVAAYLKRIGLDITEIKQIFQTDFDAYKARFEIVKDAEIIDKQIAISICREDYDNLPTLVAQAADELLSITGILASFVLCQIDSIVMISSRSMGDINVQAIMEEMGGGGHLTFAGAQIAGLSIDEVKEQLLTVIKEYFEK